MPEFCPQDYSPQRATAPQFGAEQHQQFAGGSGRDWQQDCLQSGYEESPDRWQKVSADIWTNRGDLPQTVSDFLVREQQAVERADKLDPQRVLQSVHAGINRKTQIDLQIAGSLARNESPSATLRNAQNDQDWENWNNYKDYLSPASKRASMGFALIGSGIDRHIKEGERMLVEAVRLRPELQFNENFQKLVVDSYKRMARTRIDMGLPMYRGAPQLEPINLGRQAILGNDAAVPLLNDARRHGQLTGTKSATEKYDKAITESDNKDFSTLKNLRLATFVQRLLLDRTIIESEERGCPSGHLRNQRRIAADREANVYDRYMSPAKVRAESAFDMIASGDAQLFERGKKLLTDALKLRPDLEFADKFNRDKQAAFLQHFKNSRESRTEVPPIEKQPGVQDNRVYTPTPFVNRPGGTTLAPFAVPGKHQQARIDQNPPGTARETTPGGVTNVPSTENRNGGGIRTGSDSKPSGQLEKAGADSTVRFQDLPGGNPFDKEKGYSQKDIEDLALKGILALLLAGGGYKLIKKGNQYFFEKPAEAQTAKTETTETARVEKVETPRTDKVEPGKDTTSNKPEKVESERGELDKAEAERRAEELRAAETKLGKANETLVEEQARNVKLQQEVDASKQAREQEAAKAAEDRRTSTETIDKLKADITKAETDRQAEIARHTTERQAEIERLSTARQADIDRMHAEGQAEIAKLNAANKAEIEKLNEANKAEIERITTANKLEIDSVREQSKGEIDRLTAEKQAESERHATEKQQLEQSLATSETERKSEREVASAERQRLEAALSDSTKARETERQTAEAQRQQLETALKDSETARGTERAQSKETIEQVSEQLKVAQNENMEIKSRNTGLQTELEARNAKNANLKTELDTSKATNAELQRSVTETQTQKDAAESRATELQSQRDAAEQRNATLTTALQDAERQRASERELASAEQTRLKELLKTSEAGRNASDQKIESLSGELETAKTERDRITVLANRDRAQLEADISSLTEQLQKANTDKAALELSGQQERQAQQRELAELTTKLTDAETKLANANKTIADAEKEKAETGKRLTDTEMKLADTEKKLSDSDKQLTDTDKKLAEANEKRASEANEHSESKQALEQQVRDLTARMEQVTEQQRQSQEQRTTERTALESRVTELGSQLEQARTQHTSTTGQLTASVQKVAELTQHLEQARAKHSSTTEQLASSEKKATELAQQLAASDKKTTELTQQLAASDKKTTELTQQLADSRAREATAGEQLTTSDSKVSELTSQLEQQQTERKTEQQAHATERATTAQQVAELQEKLAKAATEKQTLEDSTAKMKADFERQLAEANKGAEQAEEARVAAARELAAERARAEAAEQGKATAIQEAATERTRATIAEQARDTASSELGTERARAEAQIKTAASEAAKQPVKPAESSNPAETPVETRNTPEANAEKRSNTADAAPAQTNSSQTPRRRIRGGAVQLDTTVVAQNEGNGTFSREVSQAGGIDGSPESKGERISTDQIQLVKEEIQKLRDTKIASEEAKARNLERVLSILERTDSPRVQEAAHKYIATRITEGESAHVESRGGARASLGRGVSAGIVVSAFLAFYAKQEESLRQNDQLLETPATVGGKTK